jgi:hypothetical protein
MCILGNCQWCGEPYFAGAVISIDGFPPPQAKVKVTLRLTVGQSVCLDVEPLPVLMTKCLLLCYMLFIIVETCLPSPCLTVDVFWVGFSDFHPTCLNIH